MKVYVNSNNEIKDVGSNSLSDPSLTELIINDDANPFNGWTSAKICCYKVQVSDGYVMMMTPYIDSRLIDNIDQLGREVEQITPTILTKTAYLDDTEVVFTNVPKGNITVYVDDFVNHTVVKDGNSIIVRFEPLEKVTKVTLSVV